MPARKKSKRKAAKKPAIKTSEEEKNQREDSVSAPPPKPPHPNQGQKMSSAARRFVLKSIAEYQPYAIIVQELKTKYGFERTIDTLKGHYGNNPQYKPQIQKYRDRFNNAIADEPLASKRHLLQILYDTLNDARSAGDYKGAASITKQIREMLGYTTPAEVEVNHHIGGLPIEQRLKALFDTRQAPPPLPGNDITLLPGSQTVDVEPEDDDETDGG